jgi:hypothetical protein
MRIITRSLLLLALFALPLTARAADGASVHAVLVTASNKKGAADPRLAAYEAVLQRNLPESSFQYVTEGKAVVDAKNTRATLALASGHRLELEWAGREADGVVLKVQWTNGRTVIMSNSMTLPPGGPGSILGRRPSGDGDVPLIIIMAR